MVGDRIKRQLRSAQTHFPSIRAAKFSAYNWATRNLGWRVEPEFKLLDALAPCNLAIDIGANWGQSVYALKRHARPQKIISFEPNPQLAARLKHIFRADATVQIEPCALGNEAGEFSLYIPSYREFQYDGLASLDFDSAAEWLNPDRLARFDPKKLSINQHSIEVRTLDRYGVDPDIIKIDVQGHEEAVVTGAELTIARCQPVMIVEDPTEGVIDRLSAAGLDHYGLVDGRLVSGNLSQPNSVFLSKATYERLAG